MEVRLRVPTHPGRAMVGEMRCDTMQASKSSSLTMDSVVDTRIEAILSLLLDLSSRFYAHGDMLSMMRSIPRAIDNLEGH